MRLINDKDDVFIGGAKRRPLNKLIKLLHRRDDDAVILRFQFATEVGRTLGVSDTPQRIFVEAPCCRRLRIWIIGAVIVRRLIGERDAINKKYDFVYFRHTTSKPRGFKARNRFSRAGRVPDVTHFIVTEFEIDALKAINDFLRGIHLVRTHDLQ